MNRSYKLVANGRALVSVQMDSVHSLVHSIVFSTAQNRHKTYVQDIEVKPQTTDNAHSFRSTLHACGCVRVCHATDSSSSLVLVANKLNTLLNWCTHCTHFNHTHTHTSTRRGWLTHPHPLVIMSSFRRTVHPACGPTARNDCPCPPSPPSPSR